MTQPIHQLKFTTECIAADPTNVSALYIFRHVISILSLPRHSPLLDADATAPHPDDISMTTQSGFAADPTTRSLDSPGSPCLSYLAALPAHQNLFPCGGAHDSDPAVRDRITTLTEELQAHSLTRLNGETEAALLNTLAEHIPFFCSELSVACATTFLKELMPLCARHEGFAGACTLALQCLCTQAYSPPPTSTLLDVAHDALLAQNLLFLLLQHVPHMELKYLCASSDAAVTGDVALTTEALVKPHSNATHTDETVQRMYQIDRTGCEMDAMPSVVVCGACDFGGVWSGSQVLECDSNEGFGIVEDVDALDAVSFAEVRFH